MDDYSDDVLVVSVSMVLVFKLSIIGSCSLLIELKLRNLSELGN